MKIEHWIGQRVRNRQNGWFGSVVAMECVLCGYTILTPHEGCGAHGFRYCLTVEQCGFLKPWCRVVDYEDATVLRTAWERVMEPLL